MDARTERPFSGEEFPVIMGRKSEIMIRAIRSGYEVHITGGRDIVTCKDLEELHRHLKALLKDQGVAFPDWIIPALEEEMDEISRKYRLYLRWIGHGKKG